MLRIVSTILTIFISIHLFSQDREWNEQAIHELLETSVQGNENSTEYNALLDKVRFLLQQPLDLNSASKEDLHNSGLFNAFQIEEILRFRHDLGSFVEVQELKSLHGFNDAFVDLLIPLCTIGDVNLALSSRWHHQVIFKTTLKLEDQAGFLNSNFEGNKSKVYTRYKVQKGNIFQAGITLEKDAGESLFAGSNPSFDFISPHLQVKVNKHIKQLNIGDFKAQWGQGLVLWNGLNFRKSALVNSTARAGQELSSYTSVNEADFLRGVGARIQFGQTYITPFVSFKKIDASLHAENTNTVSTIRTSGLHRTANERQHERNVEQFISGFRIAQHYSDWKISSNNLFTYYDKPFQKGAQLYEVHEPEGQQFMYNSIDFDYFGRKWHAFGEGALFNGTSSALALGVNFFVDAKFTWSLSARRFEASYFSQFGQAFSERSTVNNESGLYIGFDWNITPQWRLKAYYDLYRHPWLLFGVNGPSSGRDHFAQLDFSPNDSYNAYFRIQSETKGRSSSDLPVNNVIDYTRIKSRLQQNIEVNTTLHLRTRAELIWTDEIQNEFGLLIYQDAKINLCRQRLALTGRIQYFHTASFNSAIYAFEPDVLYSFSSPAFYRQGVSPVLVLKYRIASRITLWTKLARQTLFSETDQGSGDSFIDSNHNTTFKILLIWEK